MPKLDHDEISDLIAACIKTGREAERARCARIADGFKREKPIIQDTIGHAQHITAKAIAAAIRHG